MIAGRMIAAFLAGAYLFAVPVAVSAQETAALPPVPRSGSVDVPLAMSGIPPLQPVTAVVANGPRRFVKTAKGTFGGRRLAYRAELQEMTVEDAGMRIGTLFTTAYTVDAKRTGNGRPVIFAFNGGPGASSAFLHFASLGPRRLQSVETADFGDAGNGLVDNPASPLDIADIVFMDPIDAGFGRSAPGQGAKFRSVDADAGIFARAAINWLKTHDRLDAPVFLFGESYGTMRVVAMARDLARGPEKLVVSGIVMAGTAYTFGANGRTPNPMLVASELPMMASVAWLHGKIDNRGQNWAQAVEKARAYVRDRYAGAVMMGNRLDPATRESVIKALPGIIGIPERYFRESGRITVGNFNAELLRAEGKVLDSNDGRYAMAASAVPDSLDTRYGAFITASNAYMADELGATGIGDYRLFDPAMSDPGYWTMRIAGDPALDVTLARLIADHPAMKLLVLQGRYDTLTDLGTTEYVLGQTDIPPSRYRIAYFDGGHMLMPAAEALDPLRAMIATDR